MARESGRKGGGAILQLPARAAGFLAYVGRRFVEDRCLERASALTFSTVLALVPLLAISFAIFSAFPAYSSLRADVQTFIFDNFVPGVGAVVSDHLDRFTEQTGRLTAVGVVFLAISAVMLLSTINETFNGIWRVRERRSVVGRLLAYWAVLTLAPVLFGISLTLSGYLFTAAEATGVEGALAWFARLTPALLAVMGFTVLYLVLPNFPVRRRDALLGGLLAGILFESLKKAFGFYVSNFPTYETVYGALATVPILLLWMYLAWTTVLIGAEIAAALPAWRAGATARRSQPTKPAGRLALALSILSRLDVAFRFGGVVSTRNLATAVPGNPETVAGTLERLQRQGYITKSERGRWLLSRDLGAVTLATFLDDLGLRLKEEDLTPLRRSTAPQPLIDVLHELDEREADLLCRPVRDLLYEDGIPVADDAAARTAALEDAEETEAAAKPRDRRGRIARLTAFLGLTWIGTS